VREWGEGKCPSDPQISHAYRYLASACPHAVLSRARSFMHRSLGGATRVMRHRIVNYKLHAVVIRVASVTWHNADPSADIYLTPSRRVNLPSPSPDRTRHHYKPIDGWYTRLN